MVRQDCQIPDGCLYDDEARACPLCDEDGADKIATFYSERTNAEFVFGPFAKPPVRKL